MFYFAFILVIISTILYVKCGKKYKYFKHYKCQFEVNEQYRQRAENGWFYATLISSIAVGSSIWLLFLSACCVGS